MLHLHTLGTAVIEVGSTRLTPGSSRAFASLLYLAAHRGEPVMRSSLAALLFPETDDASALHNLRQLLYRLRQTDAPLEADADGVQLKADDVQDDYSAMLDGRPLATTDIDRVGGGFLPGYAPEFSQPYSEWLDTFRGGITLRLRTQLVAELTRSRRTGQWERVASVARACLALDALNEEATCALAEALALAGSKHEAVALLDSYLAEVGGTHAELRVPATVLRRRIAERMPDPIYRTVEQAPLIGREHEMAALDQAFRRARAGEPQTVLISGEAGIGKSRLVSEFGKIAALEGAMVITVGLQPHDRRRPLAVFMDLIPVLKGLPGALGCAPESLQFLTQLIAVDTPAAPSADAPQPHTVFANATRAIADLLDAVSSEAPLVIIVEDVHWIDRLSLLTLSDLTLGHPTRRVLLVLTSRDARVLAEAPAEIVASPVALSPLAEGAATTLIRRLLRNTPGEADTDLHYWCLKAADGNPYFMHALAAHHGATGERFAVPPSLTELLARRLDRLPRRVARVFDACVLLGKHATIQRLHDVLGVGALDLAESLGALEDGGFVVPEGKRLRSSHFLLSDAALQRVPESAATLLHGAVARVFEAENPEEQDASLLWDAVEHWVAAGDRSRAVAILAQHADRASASRQPQFAVEMLEKALELSSGEDARISLARKLLDSSQQCNDASRGLVAIDVLRTCRPRGAQTEHDEVELLEIQFKRLIGSDAAPVITHLLACVRSRHATEEHRLEAARLLLVESVSRHDAATAKLAYRIATRLAPESTPGLRQDIELVYQASLGDMNRAASIAHRLLEQSGHSGVGGALLPLNAIPALYVAGAVDDAIQAAASLYTAGSDHQQWYVAHYAAAMRAMIHLDQGNLPECRSWLDKSQAASPRLLYLVGSHIATAVRLAILEERLDDASFLLDGLVRDYPRMRTQRFSTIARAYAMRIRQLRGERPRDDEPLEELLAEHVAACMQCQRDDMVAITWHGLVERGRREEADDFVDTYLSAQRRDRCPPIIELRRVLTARGICPIQV